MKNNSLISFLIPIGLVCFALLVGLILFWVPISDAKKFQLIDRNSRIPNLITYAPIKQIRNHKQSFTTMRSEEKCAVEMSWCLMRSIDESLQGSIGVLSVSSDYIEAGVEGVSLVGEIFRDKYGARLNHRKLTLLGSKRLRGEGAEAFMREISIATRRVGSGPIFSTRNDPSYKKWVIASGGQAGSYTFQDPAASSLVRFENPARTTWLGLYEAPDGPRMVIVNKPKASSWLWSRDRD